MADASVHGDTRNAVILCDIRNRQDKLCQNMEETVTILACTSYRRQCHSNLNRYSFSSFFS